MVRAVIAFTVLAGVLMFVMGISEDEVRLRETGVMLSVVLPVIGLLEDRIYRKSRERYLETKAAAERQKAGLAAISQPAGMSPPDRPAIATAAESSLPARSGTGQPTPDYDAVDWYGLYG